MVDMRVFEDYESMKTDVGLAEREIVAIVYK
jgi:hypothetical protein